MIDAVLSYHTDPQRCGVARFNLALAKRLGVAMLGLNRHPHITPLISVKWSELNDGCDPWSNAEDIVWYRTYDLFLHDDPGINLTDAIKKARRVYVADPAIRVRNDQINAFCPATLGGIAARGQYRVLTYGMLHKQHAAHYVRLKQQLDTEHPDYTVELSAAVHEGKKPYIEETANELRSIFGDRLRVLGFLSDDALAKELHDVDAVALYYSPALRANNTTYWAAVEAGKTIYTNRDEHSPKESDPPASWDRLIELLR